MFQFPADAAPVSLETIPTIGPLKGLVCIHVYIKWLGKVTSTRTVEINSSESMSGNDFVVSCFVQII